MPANYVLISEYTTSVTTASVTFSNIPQTGYSDLKIVVSGRSNAVRDDDYAVIALNGVTTNQSARVIYGTGSATGSVSGTPVSTPICAANNTANTFGNSEIYIPNYTSNTNKAFTQIGVLENNATWGVQNIGAGLWSPGTSAPVTSIVFTSTYGSFVAGSSFSIYGIAAFGTTPSILPKATGGDIVTNDGTYWYHAFLSSGVFTPSQTLSCDALVIAGGGGGGSNAGGGGGAGGYRSATALSTTAIPYAVTVGAGGTGSPSGTPVSGSDSIFSTITSTGGGRGGSNAGYVALTGGSGGGGGMADVTYTPGAAGNTPSTSPAQGTNGGNGSIGSNEAMAAGGGGGAISGGGNASGATPGNGGAGSNSFSTWASATGTGVSGYYAGGGGGGAWNNTYAQSTGGAGGGGAGGRGGGGVWNNSSAGIANTGGGGGGGGTNASIASSNGGSGIVIVRYTMA